METSNSAAKERLLHRWNNPRERDALVRAFCMLYQELPSPIASLAELLAYDDDMVDFSSLEQELAHV